MRWLRLDRAASRSASTVSFFSTRHSSPALSSSDGSFGEDVSRFQPSAGGASIRTGPRGCLPISSKSVFHRTSLSGTWSSVTGGSPTQNRGLLSRERPPIRASMIQVRPDRLSSSSRLSSPNASSTSPLLSRTTTASDSSPLRSSTGRAFARALRTSSARYVSVSSVSSRWGGRASKNSLRRLLSGDSPRMGSTRRQTIRHCGGGSIQPRIHGSTLGRPGCSSSEVMHQASTCTRRSSGQSGSGVVACLQSWSKPSSDARSSNIPGPAARRPFGSAGQTAASNGARRTAIWSETSVSASSAEGPTKTSTRAGVSRPERLTSTQPLNHAFPWHEIANHVIGDQINANLTGGGCDQKGRHAGGRRVCGA